MIEVARAVLQHVLERAYTQSTVINLLKLRKGSTYGKCCRWPEVTGEGWSRSPTDEETSTNHATAFLVYQTTALSNATTNTLTVASPKADTSRASRAAHHMAARIPERQDGIRKSGRGDDSDRPSKYLQSVPDRTPPANIALTAPTGPLTPNTPGP